MTGRGSERLGILLVPLLGALTALLALPFLLETEIVWADLSLPLNVGSILLALAVLVHGCLVLSPRRAIAFLVLAVATGWSAEVLGLASGFPFGTRYSYNPDLAPFLPGGVPLFIPLAWYVITAAPFVLLRGIRLRRNRRLRPGVYALKVFLASVYVCGVDLILDPLAVSVAAWTWKGGGSYFDTPLSNYAGWLGIAAFVAAVHLPWSEPFHADLARKLDTVFAWLGVLFLGLATVALTERLGSVVPTLVALPLLLPGALVFLRSRRSANAKAPQGPAP